MFDAEFTNSDNMLKTVLVFLNWNPESAPLKGRFLYANGKENFKQKLDLQTKDWVMTNKNDVNIIVNKAHF